MVAYLGRALPRRPTNPPEGARRANPPSCRDANSYHYDSETQTLTIGAGAFAPVGQQVWDFEVSKLKILGLWLGFRMQDRQGKKSSDLDETAPTKWTQTSELFRLLAVLEHTVEATPQAAGLLERIVSGSLISAGDVPSPLQAERKPPNKQGAASII